jgi:hypothetical protein
VQEIAQGARSEEQGARGEEQGARSKERGAREMLINPYKKNNNDNNKTKQAIRFQWKG